MKVPRRTETVVDKRRVRDDGELAEEVVFELDADGAVTGFRRNSNVRSKID